MSECRGVFGAEKSVSTWWGTDLHMQGSPTSGLRTSVSCLISGGIRLERKCTIHVCLNHPETISMPRSMEKLSSLKSVPGAKKSWGLLFKGYIYFFLIYFAASGLSCVMQNLLLWHMGSLVAVH